MAASSAQSSTRGGSGRHRRRAHTHKVLVWLRTGSVVAALGAAVATGHGVAAADTGAGSDGSTSTATRTDGTAQVSAAENAVHGKATATTSLKSTGTASVTAKPKSSAHEPTVPAVVKPASKPNTPTPSETAVPATGIVNARSLATPAPHASVSQFVKKTAVAAMSKSAAAAAATIAPTAGTVTPTFPPAVTAPVTLSGIVSDLRNWSGLPPLGQNSPIPAIPIVEPFAALWIGVRELHYRLDNRYPTASPTTSTEQPYTGVITGNLNATDRDGDHLTYTVAAGPANGSVLVNDDGSFTYTPNAAEAHAGGTDTFKVTVSDDNEYNVLHVHGLFDLLGFTKSPTVAVPITVTAVSTPVITVSAVAGTPDAVTGVTTITLIGTDSAGNALTYTAASSQGTLVPNPTSSTTLTFTPGPGYTPVDVAANPTHAVDTIAISATDGTGAVGTTNVTITQKPVTTGPPVISEVDTTLDTKTGKETVTITATDPTGKTLTYTVDTGTLTSNTDGTYTYAPSLTAGGTSGDNPVTYTLTATDGDATTHTTVTVATYLPGQANPQDPSAITVSTLGGPTSAADLAGTLPPASQGPDGYGNTLVRYELPNHATLQQDPLTITATNPDGTITKTTLVQPPAPVITEVDTTLDTSTGKETVTITATDPTGKTLTYTVDTGTLTSNTDGTYTYAPSLTAGGTSGDNPVTYTLTATDGDATTHTTVTVATYLPGQANPQDPSAITVSTLGGPTSAADLAGTLPPASQGPDGYGNTLVRYELPNHATLQQDPLTITATNPDGTITKTTLVQLAANRPPVAGTPTVGTPDATTGSVSGALGFTDPDGDPLTYTVSTPSSSGTVAVDAAGAYTFTPTTAARASAATSPTPVTATFTVTANDGRGGTTGEQVTVTVLPAQSPVTKIGAGDSPVGIAVSPDGSRLYVGSAINYHGVVTVIDTATHTVIGTIHAGDDPEQVILSPDGSRLYVIDRSSSTVSVVDTATDTVVGTAGVNNPDRLAFTPDGTLAYVTSDDSEIFDINTATLVPGPLDSGGYLKPIEVNRGSLLTGIAISPSGGTIYVADFTDSSVSLVSTATNTTIGAAIPVGANPNALTLSPDGSRLYVTAFDGNTVSVIDTATAANVATITVGKSPLGMAVSPDGSRVYVANRDSNTISVIDSATNTVINTVAVGNSPEFIALSPDGQHVYVTVDGDYAVDEITGI